MFSTPSSNSTLFSGSLPPIISCGEVVISSPKRDAVDSTVFRTITAGDAVRANESDFVIDENGVLTRYQGSGGDVVIPDGVASIGEFAFDRCSSLIKDRKSVV